MFINEAGPINDAGAMRRGKILKSLLAEQTPPGGDRRNQIYC